MQFFLLIRQILNWTAPVDDIWKILIIYSRTFIVNQNCNNFMFGHQIWPPLSRWRMSLPSSYIEDSANIWSGQSQRSHFRVTQWVLHMTVR